MLGKGIPHDPREVFEYFKVKERAARRAHTTALALKLGGRNTRGLVSKYVKQIIYYKMILSI